MVLEECFYASHYRKLKAVKNLAQPVIQSCCCSDYIYIYVYLYGGNKSPSANSALLAGVVLLVELYHFSPWKAEAFLLVADPPPQ